MAAGPDPDQALAELIDVSAQIEGAAILSDEGAVLASIGGVGDGAADLVHAADEAARLLGRPPISQCEVGLGDRLVFCVREGTRTAVALAAADATAGLVFYDLRQALRGPEGA
ncbi:MAG: hypothetical protein ACO3KD_02735 [Gaiellales bacterium]|jgi:predicted regulator of Ras-like GTPase activity (Roadblock/LC7/MglB family)